MKWNGISLTQALLFQLNFNQMPSNSLICSTPTCLRNQLTNQTKLRYSWIFAPNHWINRTRPLVRPRSACDWQLWSERGPSSGPDGYLERLGGAAVHGQRLAQNWPKVCGNLTKRSLDWTQSGQTRRLWPNGGWTRNGRGQSAGLCKTRAASQKQMPLVCNRLLESNDHWKPAKSK